MSPLFCQHSVHSDLTPHLRHFTSNPSVPSGTLGYMNRHLKTDIAGIPHRSLDTYTHSSPPRPPASGHSFPGGSSFRQPAPLKPPGYQPTYPNPPGYHRSSSHPLSASKSADSSCPHQRVSWRAWFSSRVIICEEWVGLHAVYLTKHSPIVRQLSIIAMPRAQAEN